MPRRWRVLTLLLSWWLEQVYNPLNIIRGIVLDTRWYYFDQGVCRVSWAIVTRPGGPWHAKVWGQSMGTYHIFLEVRLFFYPNQQQRNRLLEILFTINITFNGKQNGKCDNQLVVNGDMICWWMLISSEAQCIGTVISDHHQCTDTVIWRQR